MKKFIMVLFAALLIFNMSACLANNDSSQTDSDTAHNSETTQDSNNSVLDSDTAPTPPGGVTVITADLIPTTPVKEIKTFTFEGHTFTYYNVFSDGEGNFVMADNTSYIANNDIIFGLSVKSEYVYSINDNEQTLIDYNNKGDDGYYYYSVESYGIEIRGISTSISMLYENINIGKITHWC